MPTVLRDENFRQLEAWGLVAILWALEWLGILILAEGEKVIPGFVSRFTALYSTTITGTLALSYCGWRFGRITSRDLYPRRKDFIVLGLSVIPIFFYFGLTVGREGVVSEMHEAIRGLPKYQYWLSVLNVLVITPFLEESIYRRYLLEIFRLHYPTSTSVVLVAGIATGFHWGLPFWSLVFTFFAQLLFGLVYANSRLVASTLVHSFMNMFVLGLSR